ncbi:MAG TPA: DUF4276 family protein [Rhodospirillales bacterium]|nr:DUF4276 family protein [Rhodospirillales bacterium]
MKVVLNEILPQILPMDIEFLILEHEGKSDLEKSIPRKLKGWKTPNTHFVVLRDNDGADCIQIKNRLVTICSQNGRPDTLVRIVCQELEAWFIGDLAAIDSADLVRNSRFKEMQGIAKFRDPDKIVNPKDKLRHLIPGYQAVSGARSISKHLNLNQNRSASFQTFVSGVQQLANNAAVI